MRSDESNSREEKKQVVLYLSLKLGMTREVL
jgi:hypothetical protein